MIPLESAGISCSSEEFHQILYVSSQYADLYLFSSSYLLFLSYFFWDQYSQRGAHVSHLCSEASRYGYHHIIIYYNSINAFVPCSDGLDLCGLPASVCCE